MIEKLISGGQTGVDRAALDAAIGLGIPCGGWCPKGRIAEDGTIASTYPLIETPTADYAERTEWNVRDSDGTLIITWGPPTDGTAFTVECAERGRKPCFILDMGAGVGVGPAIDWLRGNAIRVLNVAGPRESKHPGAHAAARALLHRLFARLGADDI